jgi:MFS family permease
MPLFKTSKPYLAIALAAAWGYVADRTSKTAVLGINLLGNILYMTWFFLMCLYFDSLPIELVWLSSVGYLLGAGPRSASSLALAMVTDEAQEPQLSGRLYYTYSAFLLSELVAPIIGSFSMTISIWINIALAMATVGLCFLVVLGTGSFHRSKISSELSAFSAVPTVTDHSQRRTEISYTHLVREETPSQTMDPKPGIQIRQHLRFFTSQIYGNLTRSKSGSVLVLVWAGFLICPVRQILVFEILIPFASQRFGLKISEAGFIIPTIASTNLVMFCLIIPQGTKYLRVKYGVSGIRANILTVKASLIALVFGCIGIGFVPDFIMFLISTIVFASGFCVRLALLALQTDFIDPSALAQVYGLVTTLEGLGGMVEGVAFQKVFAVSIELGRGWIASPFWLGAAIYLSYFVAIYSLQEPRGHDQVRRPLRD